MPQDYQEIFLTPREQRSNFGLAVWHARPRYMDACHQHSDVEVNYMRAGKLTYLHSGRIKELHAGDLAVFWAGRPHQAIETPMDAECFGCSIPLGWVLNWHLPDPFVRRLLDGEMLTPAREGPVSDIGRLFEHWVEDLIEDSAERRKTMLLEMEAWLHRVAQAVDSIDATPAKRVLAEAQGSLEKIEQMARYITEHYMDPLSVKEVARAVGLHENYAATLFHKRTGATLVDFIARQRLGHAQMLLATTDMKVLQIALEAGFGSASRFYAVFKSACGMAPSEYRGMIRASRFARRDM